ncbi:MAG: cyclic nucleotide-binding domain-containing protein [Armatimonadetes bacterium]|nr:cyclic nucleotide-binding domain-containing protein [Armatimonadota bacterium]
MAPTGPLPGQAVAAPGRDPEWWLRPLKWVGLIVWLAIPVFTYFHIHRPWPAHVIWSVIIAGLPLFIVLVGYHRWRRICPLAFFSQIPVYLRRPGTRRASPWLEEHYYYFLFSFFALGLWLRLTIINGVGEALAVFFVLISALALICGALFTGKTWCNYICPISLIEKINTEPHGLRETPNSQCVKCTACKKSCPDINEENGYWKEIHLRSKRFAYFAFPGLVFAFFLYFYLQAGTWDYYFLGGWADQPRLIYRAFIPDDHPMSFGFFFLPETPRWLAALLTLAAGALASFLLLSKLEPSVGRWLRRQQPEADEAQVRHLMFTMAAFVAFINFYAFAGQPLLRLDPQGAPWLRTLGLDPRAVPWLGMLPGILASVVGTLFLARRFGRTQKTFAEETVAQNIIKRWEWQDMRPPRDLREALLIHTARSSERKTGYAQVLEVYKEAVRVTLAAGFVTREEVQRLESLRNQLQIKKADHEKIMATLAEEERALLDPATRPSAEKVLQLETYRRALEQHLKLVLAADGAVDPRFIQQLQREFNVTDGEHAAQLDALLGGTQGMAMRVAEELREVVRAGLMITALEAEPSPVHDFLVHLLQRKRARAGDRLVRILQFDSESDGARMVRDWLGGNDPTVQEAVFQALRAKVTPALGERLLSVRQEAVAEDAALRLVEKLRVHTESTDPYVRASALYALAERGEVDLDLLHRLTRDEHELVRETLQGLMERMRTRPDTRRDRPPLTRLEKMIALRSVPWFASLEPESLAELARSSDEVTYAPGDVLAREGEPGDEAFIVLDGEVLVSHKVSADEEKVIDTNRPGAVIGELAVLDPAPRSATLRAAAEGARVLRIDGAAFREALHADPAVANGVIRTLAQRMRGLIRQVGG